MTSFADSARRYSELGWALTPTKGKEGYLREWPSTPPADPDHAAGKAASWGRAGRNLGVVLGTSHLIVFEYDDERARGRFLELLGGDLPQTPVCRTGSGKLHVYFHDPGGVEKITRDGLELRAGEHLCVAPPSLHPDTGQPYEWLDGHEPWDVPLIPPPADVIAYFATTNGKSIPERIAPGDRHDSFVTLAATLSKAGITERAIVASLRGLNVEQGDPPKHDDQELIEIARAAMSWRVRDSQGGRKLNATPLTEITMRSIRWLEKPLWQRSAFQLLAAPKGAGKGTYLASLAARVSRTDNVLFVATEDSAEIDLKPRLVAAGAHMERCFLIREDVRLPDDVDALRELGESLGSVRLFVIDPVANHIGSSNSNSEGEVRHAIGGLNKLADALDCLLIGVRHPGKDRTRGVFASVLGSTAWVDVPRAVVMIAKDDQDETLRHIQVVAGNRSLNGAAQAFRIEAVNVQDLTEPITRAVALGESTKTIEDLYAGQPSATVGDAVQATILEALATGEKTRDYLDTVCRDTLAANPDTVYKSGLEPLRKQGRIRARKAGLNDGWYWRLAGDTE